MLLGEDEILRNIGKNIRKYRELRGLTREELAEIAEIDSGYLGQCEQGETQLGITKTVRLIRYFGVSPQEIIAIPCEGDYNKKHKYINEISDILEKCTDNQLAVVLKLLQTVIPFLKE